MTVAIETYAPVLAELAPVVGGYDGKRVLEVGSDQAGGLLRALDAEYAPLEVVGANPGFPTQRFSDRTRRENLDARSMPQFPDDHFDLVVSWSAFEHVQQLDEVLAELHRVMRPGGLLYSHFGPIWSTSYGHHLWLETPGRTLSYHDAILPSWCHLLDTREEVFAWCEPALGAEVAEQVTRWVFDDPSQNQQLFGDYERMVADSPFETVFLKGYDYPELAKKYTDARDPARHALLRERFGDTERFMYDGIELLLSKNAASPPRA